MEFSLTPIFKNVTEDKEKIELLKELNELYLEESYKGNKVAYYYENLTNGEILTYNPDICFYAASIIKVLLCLLIFEMASRDEIDLNRKVLVTMDDLKQDTGTIKYQSEDTEYTILELLRLTIVESDNTAYIKLVSLVGADRLKEYGITMGANHTLEGRDLFGLTNCRDMAVYWKAAKKFIDSDKRYGTLFKEYLLNPSEKLIRDDSLDDNAFIRKFGSWDIAYHECGYVETNNPFILVILTQLNQKDYKEEFINDTAKILVKINKK